MTLIILPSAVLLGVDEEINIAQLLRMALVAIALLAIDGRLLCAVRRR